MPSLPAPIRRLQRRRPLVALVTLILLLVLGYTARAVGHHGAPPPAPPSPSASATSGSAAVELSTLPLPARQTVALIERGGPFPYRHDGIVYANRERQLPPEPAGFYREYTVVTPGSVDRGERRIVTGRDGRYWYTGDHYASFRRIDLSG